MRELYDRTSRATGSPTHLAMSLRPEAITGWRTLSSRPSHADGLTARAETLAAAPSAAPIECWLTKVLVPSSTAAQVDIAQISNTAGLAEVDVAIMSLADKVARHAEGLLKISKGYAKGLTDDEIWMSSLRCGALLLQQGPRRSHASRRQVSRWKTACAGRW
jgi:hypothetical protein